MRPLAQDRPLLSESCFRDRLARISGYVAIPSGERAGPQGVWQRSSYASDSLAATTDVTYVEPDTVETQEIIDHAISTLAADSGVLRCKHGDRLVALYGRGVAALEIAPRARCATRNSPRATCTARPEGPLGLINGRYATDHVREGAAGDVVDGVDGSRAP